MTVVSSSLPPVKTTRARMASTENGVLAVWLWPRVWAKSTRA